MAEDSDANWTGQTGGTCNGGLPSIIGGGATPTGSPAVQDDPYSGDISGDDHQYCYTVCNITSPSPTSSFTITVTPTANASLSPGWVASGDEATPLSAAANVTYKVAVSSIQMVFTCADTGTNGNSTNDVLGPIGSVKSI